MKSGVINRRKSVILFSINFRHENSIDDLCYDNRRRRV